MSSASSVLTTYLSVGSVIEVSRWGSHCAVPASLASQLPQTMLQSVKASTVHGVAGVCECPACQYAECQAPQDVPSVG
ncbi:hypothetical protein GCM10009504_09250 [Pseudomonas laurentiana]|nr:hypothetical protein GCM10009504_09250 [Pseudomonas laurentiana]